MRKWNEGQIHVAMRAFLRAQGFQLVAGEYPGGSDHELYPLNITDPIVARDNSPDPRRHSSGELIPDIVALKRRVLLIGEAKIAYSSGDFEKLLELVTTRRPHLLAALERFAAERQMPDLLPVATLQIIPMLAFSAAQPAPAPSAGFIHLRLHEAGGGFFQGAWPSEKFRCA